MRWILMVLVLALAGCGDEKATEGTTWRDDPELVECMQGLYDDEWAGAFDGDDVPTFDEWVVTSCEPLECPSESACVETYCADGLARCS